MHREGKTVSICWFTPQTAAKSGAEPEWTQEFLPVFHMGAGFQIFKPSFTASTGHMQGAGSQVGQAEHELAPLWDTSTLKYVSNIKKKIFKFFFKKGPVAQSWMKGK